MRRILANILFVFVGLPLALSALMLISVRPWALDREIYKRFVEDDRLYTALQAPEISVRAPAIIKLGAATFDGPALAAAVQKNLPTALIKSTASGAVDSAMDALVGRGSGGRLEIDLKPLKAALKSKTAEVTREYAAALAAGRSSGAASGAPRAALSPPAALGLALPMAIAALPDKAVATTALASKFVRLGLPLGAVAKGPSIGGRTLTQALLNRMTATTAAMSALLLAGLGALGGSGALSRLSRAGRYLFIPSVLVLALGAVLAIPGGLILNTLPLELRGMLAGAGGTALRAYLESALGPIARGFFITGLVGASVGAVLAQAKRLAEPKVLE